MFYSIRPVGGRGCRRCTRNTKPVFAVMAFSIMVPAFLPVVRAGSGFSLTWSTVDGGGVAMATGGDFELSGTIGQTDANTVILSGDGFDLVGGFWAIRIPVCGCPADVNDDGLRDGRDVQVFIGCLVASAGGCVCADIQADGAVNFDDVSLFVDTLLGSTSCP